MTVLTQNEFEQDPDRAVKATAEGPVFIMDQGEPKQVILSIETYRRMKSGEMTLAEAVAAPGLSDIELDLPDFRDTQRSVDFP